MLQSDRKVITELSKGLKNSHMIYTFTFFSIVEIGVNSVSRTHFGRLSNHLYRLMDVGKFTRLGVFFIVFYSIHL